MRVPPPAPGPGNWAGAPSAALGDDGVVVAYRVRTATGRGGAVVVGDVRLTKDRFGAESLERPALVHTGDAWRLSLSCATPGSKHWWICALEAPTLKALDFAEARTVFAGDERTGVKDPVLRRRDGAWHA